ncbi:MAG: PPOX class F420-dependent oxidoreductase [Acidimicrobiales bacterium]
MADPAALTALIAEHRRGVLATLKRDGRPQLSNIAYGVEGDVVRISVTADRAKTRNLARDPRASLHVTSADFWRWAVAEGTAELSAVTVEPGDAAGLELLALHDAVQSSPHPDPAEFFAAMVQDRRQVVRLRIERLYGQA